MDLPRLSSQRRELLAQATERYSEALVGSAAEEYLSTRGIPAEVSRRFQLGFVSDPLEGHERFRGRLAIPYLTPTGTVGMRYRALGDQEPKYDSEAGQRTALFNVRDLHRSEPWIAVCEGELDTVVMSGVVGVPAVGIPGVEHWNKSGGIWSRLLQDYETVFIACDSDKAGQKATKQIAAMVENPVVLDIRGDVNEMVLAEGPEALLEMMGLGE
jgi:DNA primase